MNKQRLARFISKYYLNGTVNSVVLNSKSNSQQLGARFISGDKSLLGELAMDKWDFEDSDIGVYDTEQLNKLLSVLDDDIKVHLKKSEDNNPSTCTAHGIYIFRHDKFKLDIEPVKSIFVTLDNFKLSFKSIVPSSLFLSCLE